MEDMPTCCMHFIKRKNRYCRMSVKKGNQFCGEHQQDSLNSNNVQDTDTNNKRIKCPLDPTHTCYRAKLPKHLTICNARKMLDARPLYIIKDINLDKEMQEVPRLKPLSQLDFSVIDAIITKINAAYEKLPTISEVILQHDVLQDTLNNTSCGKHAKKHLTQNSSLLAHLEKAGLVKNNTCYIEFGAGRGIIQNTYIPLEAPLARSLPASHIYDELISIESSALRICDDSNLTYWLAQITKEMANSCILLVDRSSHRHKNDNKLKKEEHNIYVKRVRADIADLQLNNIPEINNFRHKIGVAKHLCGTATDLSIRCLMQAINNKASGNSYGLVIAFCCHHKCEYKSFVGKKYLKQCGFTPNEFPILCSIASWATCGFNVKHTNILSDDNNDKGLSQQNIYSNERELIGYKVKTLLNWGRLEYMKNSGFDASLLRYISTDVSLENMCIIAKYFVT